MSASSSSNEGPGLIKKNMGVADRYDSPLQVVLKICLYRIWCCGFKLRDRWVCRPGFEGYLDGYLCLGKGTCVGLLFAIFAMNRAVDLIGAGKGVDTADVVTVLRI